jgi:1,4-dihydroxy-2-naphthoate octaprenyltransferase
MVILRSATLLLIALAATVMAQDAQDDYGDYPEYQDYAQDDYGNQDNLYHDYAQRQNEKDG